jgi:DNA-binding transcriptional regulator YhcF (GntR family)
VDLDKQHPMPVYLQLKEMLQNQIEQGVYRSHQKLPSERDLCQHYNLSRMTARRALKELIDEGFAYTRVGKGTFVSYKLNNSTRITKDKRETPADLDLAGITKTHYQQKLVKSILSFDAIGIERAISDALATHSLETVALKLFPEVISQLEQRHHQGEVSLLTLNYALTTLRSQLIAMVNAAAASEFGPKVILGCAPDDHHEIWPLLLALSLRRRGCLVIYLGPNIIAQDFAHVIRMTHPQLIYISATCPEAGKAVAALSQQYQIELATNLNHKNGRYPSETIFTFGGMAFKENPELISEVSGLYVGDTIELSVTKIQDLLSL